MPVELSFARSQVGRIACACLAASALWIGCGSDAGRRDDDFTPTTQAADGGVDGSVAWSPSGIDGGVAAQSGGPTGTLLFESTNDELVELDVATGNARVVMAGFDYSLHDVSPNGSELLISYYRDRPGPEEDGYELFTADRSGKLTNSWFPFDEPAYSARFGHEGRVLALLLGPPPTDLLLFERGDDRSQTLDEIETFAFMPRNRLLFVSDDAMYVTDLSSGATKQVAQLRSESFARNLALSPDGRRVALELGDPNFWANHVWVFDLGADDTANNFRQLTTSETHEGSATWSPDSRYVAVRESPYLVGGNWVDTPAPRGCPTVYLISADTPAPVRVGAGGNAQSLRMRGSDGTLRDGVCSKSEMRWVAR